MNYRGEYSYDLARVLQAIVKLQDPVKMDKITGREGGYLGMCNHTPRELNFRQVVTLDCTGLSFCTGNQRFHIRWPDNSRFWEYGASATVPTFLLSRILKRYNGVKDPRNTYVSFSEVNHELRIKEADGEFRLTTFPDLDRSMQLGASFRLREFERQSIAEIQAFFEAKI